ncbi:MAG: hypothetical protein QM479_02210 [Pseudomonadota bacterium]
MNEKTVKIWFYVSWLPVFIATIGIILSTLVYMQGWGVEKNADTIIRVFFCEITFVVSMLGLLAYMRQPVKTPLVQKIRWLNFGIVITTLLLSISFFLL